MQTHDELLEKFTEGYAKYGTEIALLVTDVTENKQVFTKEIMHKLFDSLQNHSIRFFGKPISDDCGKLTHYITRTDGWDEDEQAFNCWHDLATKGGAWVLSNGIARTRPACSPELLWCMFVHGTLSGDTAEQVDNVWKYCAFADSVQALLVYKKNEAHRDDKEPRSISDRPNADEAPALKKSKRSTVKGEAEIKLISALTIHHKYDNGSLLNQEPIKNNELAQLAKVSKSSAGRFFGKNFGEYRMYRERCKDKSTLISALKLLNQEFSPKILYGRQPPGESDREEE